MNNIIPRKDDIFCDFSNTVYTKFKQNRYGIQCGSKGNEVIQRSLKNLVTWQSKLESNLVNETDITLISSLPGLRTTRPFIIGGLAQTYKTSIQLQYELGNNEVIVDSNGCATNVVINPTACAANIEGFTYVQGTPLAVWGITHNLGFVPNVTVEDLNGNPIDGLVTVITINRITITFSTAVSGKAFLS